jgi:HlyD family secretion protein
MRRPVVLCVGAVAALAAAACSRAPQPDAHGNVEATSIVVSAEIAGRLVAFTPDDGMTLADGAPVGTIDSTELALQHRQGAAEGAATASRARQLDEQEAALEAQRASLAAARGALESQREIADRVYQRTKRLVAEEAATAQQLDQAERDVRVLADQIRAQDQQIAAAARQVAALRAERRTLASQVAAANARVAQISERLGKASIRNPLAGTVLVAYVRQGEFVQAGQPLYRIANLNEVDVRAYVTEPQLAGIRVGQPARVSVDAGRGSAALSGTVTWIAGEAEFTPTPIQTRDERADLVYAVKIRVVNPDRVLKIGMPVDVWFGGGANGR